MFRNDIDNDFQNVVKVKMIMIISYFTVKTLIP